MSATLCTIHALLLEHFLALGHVAVLAALFWIAVLHILAVGLVRAVVPAVADALAAALAVVLAGLLSKFLVDLAHAVLAVGLVLVDLGLVLVDLAAVPAAYFFLRCSCCLF